MGYPVKILTSTNNLTSHLTIPHQIRNKKGDSGSPLRRPIPNLNSATMFPFIEIDEVAILTHSTIYRRHFGGKPVFIITVCKESHSTKSYTFSKFTFLIIINHPYFQ